MTVGGPAPGPDRADDLPATLALVGAGKMGGAMLAGWLARGLPPGGVTVVDPDPSDAVRALAASHGFALNAPAASPPEALVLAVKPQALADVAPALRPLVGPRTLLVSVLAGKTVAALSEACGREGPVVRAMPNLPASIGRGATGAYANAAVDGEGRRRAEALLRAIGAVEWVDDEGLIDAVTAVSGSGPAYVFLLVERLAEAGVAAGLEPGLAGRLARETVVGAAALLDASGADPARLRADVTSPGGTTAAALDVLMAPDGLGPLLARAVAAAKRRAGELAG